MLSAVVVECPGFSLAIECYIDLKEALVLYEEGSRPCRSEASLVGFFSSRCIDVYNSHAFTEAYAKAR